jgi:hypothetical protein
MVNRFFKSETISRTELKIVIGLLFFRILSGLYVSAGIYNSMAAAYGMNILFILSQTLIVLFLYKFIHIHLKQKLFLFVIVFILIVYAYYLLTSSYILLLNIINGDPVYSLLKNQLHYNVPFIVISLMQIIVGVQLISNTAGQPLQPLIKLLGIAYVIGTVGIAAMGITQYLMQQVLNYYAFASFLFHCMPYGVMLYMYMIVLNEKPYDDNI